MKDYEVLWNQLKEWVISMNQYYDKGALCSIAESSWGKSISQEVIDKMNKIEK